MALFKLLMTDLSGDWLASLPPAGVATFDAVKTSFDARYKTPEMAKYRSAKEIFSRKQQPTADDFIAEMQKAARIIDADEKTTIYATLNGLRPELVGYTSRNKNGTP